jgi:hypothetical protein
VDRIRSDAVTASLLADMDLARRLRVTGTPASFVNGIAVSGAQPAELFYEIIDAELARARRLRELGIADSDVYRRRVAENLRSTGLEAPAGP